VGSQTSAAASSVGEFKIVRSTAADVSPQGADLAVQPNQTQLHYTNSITCKYLCNVLELVINKNKINKLGVN